MKVTKQKGSATSIRRGLHSKIRKYIFPLFGFAAIVILWQAASWLELFAVGAVPSPLEVAKGMWELILDGRLIDFSIASLFRVTVGYYLAVLAAIPIGLFIGWSSLLQDIFNPLIQFLRPISPLAWIPLALLWFGIGDPPAVFLIFLSSFFPLLVATISAVSSIDRLLVRAAVNIGMPKGKMMFKIVFPASLPAIVINLRISLGIAWLVVVAAEMIAVKSGLGYLIIDSRNALRMDWVIDSMIIIGLIGIVLDRIIRRLERLKSLRWGYAQSL